ncbi:hypothetical protein [Bdellovibrio bacteriovorus]|uniref:hypothetical protein n=1 Tax=Bdellovibrio bacteriovorus TaxID=959 RepID=UPI0035A8F7AE
MAKIIFLSYFFILASAFAEAGTPKTCRAILNGKVTPADVNPVELPMMFYPDDPIHPRSANWNGPLRMESFIAPASQVLTCGKPFATVDFGKIGVLGTMPPAILTNPWIKTGWDGKTYPVAPINIAASPSDSYEYSLPLVRFVGIPSTVIDLVSPDGTSDICSHTNLPLPTPLLQTSTIEFDASARYWDVTTDGEYRWDGNSFGKTLSPQFEVKDPSITIVCDDVYTYDATFEWPYEIKEELCPGSVHRKMTMHGEFGVIEDNKLVGYIDVEKPTVTSTGAVQGSYTGSKFTIYVEGHLYTDSEGKKRVDLPFLRGGEGISWNFLWTCPFGSTPGNLPAAVAEYLKIINYEAEMESLERSGHFVLQADLDDQTFSIDKGGQGAVTFRRIWKKK